MKLVHNKRMNVKLSVLTTSLVFGIVQTAGATTTSTTVTDAVGTQEVWTFEENLGVKNLVSRVNQVDGKGIYQTWDANNNLTSKTDAEGRVTTYAYNATNQRISMTEASGTPEARTTTYDYISPDINIVTKTTSLSVATGYNKDVINTYDAQQNVIKTEIKGFNPNGVAVSREMTFAYDSLGKVTQIDGYRTDVADITTFEYYDCQTGAECGQIKKITNALGHETTYDVYDVKGRLIQTTDSSGVVTTHTYHPRGWLLSRTQTYTNADGSTVSRTTSYAYDTEGMLVQSTSPDGTVLTYEYDAANDLRAISDNVGNRVQYTYDPKGNRSSEKTFDPDGTLVRDIQTSYDIRNFVQSINAAGSVTQMINDAVGNLTSQTDPNQNPGTQSQYDGLYRLTNTIDALTNSTGYDYNVADQLIKVTAPNGTVTEYVYDDLGNLLKEISADRGTTTYTHDDAGNVITQTDARGITATYAYDALNRLTSVSYPNTQENITYTYDAGTTAYPCHLENEANAVGKLCQVTDESGETNYQYDQWSNVKTVTRTILGINYVWKYNYDDGNRVVQITYPNDREIDYTRDVIGRITDVSTTVDGQITPIISGRQYRSDGLRTDHLYGNGLFDSRQYDLQGRLTQQIAGDGYARDFTYDANGNIKGILDTKGTRYFDYDVLDRLENQNLNSSIFSFQYDANGNRTQKDMTGQPPLSYSYQSTSNRLTGLSGAAITLDASGNTLSDQSGNRQFEYNQQGHLSRALLNGSEVARYEYNASRLRVKKITPTKTTVYHYDLDGKVLAEGLPAGDLEREYFYADGELLAIVVADDNANDIAELVSPAPGSTLTSNSVLFTWTDVNAQMYQVKVGTTPNAYDLGYVNTTGLQAIIGNLPLDGSTVYVTISTQKQGVWQEGTSHALTSVTDTALLAELVSPAPGSTLSGASATFSWTDVGADR